MKSIGQYIIQFNKKNSLRKYQFRIENDLEHYPEKFYEKLITGVKVCGLLLSQEVSTSIENIQNVILHNRK